MRLSNKVAVITGGDSGIGLACAKLFLQQGAKVAICSNYASRVVKTAQRLGVNCFGATADVRDPTQLKTFYQAVVKQFGKFDILLANAGISKIKPLAKNTERFMDELIGTNFKGTFFTVQQAEPYLQPGASVILMASNTHLLGIANFTIYSATKAAIRSMAQTLAADLLPKAVRVNSITPGATDTALLHHVGVPKKDYANFIASLEKEIPIHRIAEPEDIAKAALFLASDDSAYCVGIDLVVDGGHSQI